MDAATRDAVAILRSSNKIADQLSTEKTIESIDNTLVGENVGDLFVMMVESTNGAKKGSIYCFCKKRLRTIKYINVEDALASRDPLQGLVRLTKEKTALHPPIGEVVYADQGVLRVHGPSPVSRNTVISHTKADGTISVFRNMRLITKFHRGMAIPLYGRVLGPKSLEKLKKLSAVHPGISTVMCNSTDCPTVRRGEWWMIYTSIRHLEAYLINVGLDYSTRQVFLPLRFRQDYQQILDATKLSVSAAFLSEVFSPDLTRKWTDADWSRVVDGIKDNFYKRRRILCAFLDREVGIKDRKRQEQVHKHLKSGVRRLLRKKLARIMSISRSRLTTASAEANAIVTSRVSNAGEFQAFVVLTKALFPGQELVALENRLDLAG